MPRLFFALWPGPSVREALLSQVASLVVAAPGARPTRAENLHLTLAFLGSLPPQRIPEVLDVGAALDGAPFALTLDRLEHWVAPAIDCLTPAVVPPPLSGLAAGLRAALRGRCLPADERPYRPHVTLCRQARAPYPGRAWVSVTGTDWPVQDFVLAESADDSGRSVYSVVRRWPLRPRAGG